MDDYSGIQDSSNVTDVYASNSYSYNDSRGDEHRNDRSNDFSFSKENDSSSTTYQTYLGVDVHRSSDNDDLISRSNVHETIRSSDSALPKENDSSSVAKQGHTEDALDSSNNDNLISDIKQSSNSDSEDQHSNNGIEKCISQGLENAEDSDLKNVNFKVDSFSQNTNQDTKSDRFMSYNDTSYDNDCCSCKNSPLMCLAFFCDCFG